MRTCTIRFWATGCLAVLLLSSGALGMAQEPAAPATETAEQVTSEAKPDAATPEFSHDVAPIFRKYCVGCHAAEEPEGQLVLETYESLLAGGKRGAAIVAGEAERSRLILMLEGKMQPVMPPEGNEGPTADEIARLRTWVNAGAKSPTGSAPDPRVLITPKIDPTMPPRHPVAAVSYSPDGKMVAMAGYAEVRLIGTESRGVIRKLTGIHGSVNDLVFSKDGALLVGVGGEPGLYGEIAIWNPADGALVASWQGHSDSLYAVALSPDGNLVATGGYDQQIMLWNRADHAQVRTISGHSGGVFDLAFNPDGRLLASASADRTVKIWNVADGARMDTFGQALKELYAVAFSPDGKRVAAGGVDNRIRVWQISDTAAEGTNPLLYSRFAHQGAIISLAYSPDGKLLVSGAEDRTVRLWNPNDVSEKLLLEEQSDWPTALAFSPDNASVVVGRMDGALAFYAAKDGKPVPPGKPEVANIEPRGVQRGVATRVRLIGKNLALVNQVESTQPKLAGRVLAGESPSADEIWIELTAAADLGRGSYEILVAGPGGKSGRRTIQVDDIPQQLEVEPNNVPSEAADIAMPRSYWGTLAAKGDVDHYRFAATAGEQVVCELSANALGSKLNGVLTVLDSSGNVLASNNDFEGQDDPLLAFTAPADGNYVVRVSDLMLNGSNDHYYRLSVGTFAFVTGVHPLSVPSNQETRVSLVGYNVGAENQVVVAAKADGDADVPIDPARFRARKGFKVAVGQLPEIVEAEPNNEPAQSTPLEVPITVGGRIAVAPEMQDAAAQDVDLYRFQAKKGQHLIIETDAARRGSPVDTKIEVLDAEGKPIERLVLEATRDSVITFRPINSSTVDVRVENWEEMELNEFLYMQGEVCKIFRLPQGPDSGFNFYAWAGKRVCYFDTSATTHAVEEACYTVRPHPAGTKLKSTGLPVFPLYYSNDDDGLRKMERDSRLSFVAPVDGSYLVRVTDVRGRGGDRYSYRLTVRPAKPDFQISLSGGSPTVRAGCGRPITLTADRIDGFDGEIKVEFSGLPPGFSISSPIVIQAGQVEASAVIYAAADAKSPSGDARTGSKVTATAVIDGNTVTKDVTGMGEVKLAPRGKIVVRLEPAEVVIAPGQTVAATLKIERHDLSGAVNFDVRNLPHGVIVDNIGLNGVLIPDGETERQIFFNARNWVPETSREVFAVAITAGGDASPPLVVHVRANAPLAQATTQK